MKRDKIKINEAKRKKINCVSNIVAIDRVKWVNFFLRCVYTVFPPLVAP